MSEEWNLPESEERSLRESEELSLRESEERNFRKSEERYSRDSEEQHSRESEGRNFRESEELTSQVTVNEEIDLENEAPNHRRNEPNEEQQQEAWREFENQIALLDSKEQLYGDGENMVLLPHDVYCKRRVLKSALGSAKKSTHFIRRLIRGVFTDNAIENCTATGRSATVGVNSKKSMEQIHLKAKEAIINSAKSMSKKRKWTIQSDKELESAFASGLTVAKREIRSEKEQQVAI